MHTPAAADMVGRDWKTMHGVLLAVSLVLIQRACIKEHKLKNTTLLCAVAAAAALFAGNAEAIYKCTTPKGVVYQDRPCKEGTESDVTIVINTGELAPKAGAAQDDPAKTNPVLPDNKPGTSKSGRTTDESTSVSRPGDKNATNSPAANAADSTTKRNIRFVESLVPMNADEARRTDPSAKYYTTDAAAPGTETPGEMTCESPNGEKRRFILSNGKMTSI